MIVEVEGSNGRYFVSDDGIVYRYKFKEDEYVPLKPDLSTGKPRVRLMGVYRSVAHITAEAYIPNYYTGCTEIRHLNGDPLDNHVENLEWTTHSDLILHPE